MSTSVIYLDYISTDLRFFWTKIGDSDHCGMVVGKNLDRIFFYQGSKIGTAVNTAHSFSLVQVLYLNNQYILRNDKR